MVLKLQRKRGVSDTPGPSKKRKLSGPQGDKRNKKKKTPVNGKGKDKAADRGFIPIPSEVDDVSVSDEDVELLQEYGQAAGFLSKLDEKGITRSKKETERLHQMNRPTRKHVDDDLPSIDSGGDNDDDDEGPEAWDSDVDDDDLSISGSDREEDDSFTASTSNDRRKGKAKDISDDEEMPYEAILRVRRPTWDEDEGREQGISRLPIKLADGRVQKSSSKVYLLRDVKSETETEDEEGEGKEELVRPVVEDVSTGARFGRPAVVDVISNTSRKARIQSAKEQIASISQEIISDPENSLGLLRRLHTFSLPVITTLTHPDPVPNDPIVRKLTILSQLAVFKDIIPGYRIRALTEKEQAEKVSQLVQRTRDWEQGLVMVYQSYLKGLDAELKAKSELAEVALQCMCTLLSRVTHFNFRVNLMTSIVASISRTSWDKSSDLCLSTMIHVFRADNTGEASLELVRLLNRMIKERKFKIHPEVLSCLLHLRLRNELGVRSSDSRADKNTERVGHRKYANNRAAQRRAKGKPTDQPHLSKKAKKALREKQEIQKEMREAEAEVDKEERAVVHTETLKLLFVLYFRILKNPEPTALLPAALQGISRFAHLVNIDFFKDLMQVLKELMLRESVVSDDFETPSARSKDIQHQLLCVTTAFELLSGQGEALEIDLTDFISRLYTLIPRLGLMSVLEEAPQIPFAANATLPVSKPYTTSSLLFRALELAFTPRTSGAAGAAPSWRSAAFCKRLVAASLHWPSVMAVRALDFVKGLVERDSTLEALLSTEDRAANGVYRADLDDPQLCNPFGASFWEVHLLYRTHWDPDVREAAKKLLNVSSAPVGV